MGHYLRIKNIIDHDLYHYIIDSIIMREEHSLMNCKKCGSPLKEDAKFCTVCGSNILSENIQNPHLDTASAAQAENFDNQQQMLKDPYKNNRGNLSSNKYNPNTVFQVIAVIAVCLLLWKTAEHISLKRQIDEYENQDAVEKTIDAADSWLDKVDLNIFDLIGF